MPWVYHRKLIWFGGSILALAALIGGFWLGRIQRPSNDFITVRRGDVVQEVNVTGQVEPASRLELAFEKGGRLGRLPIKVGDRVAAGALLAQLESASLLAELAEAEARLKAEEAKLDELRRGTRREEISVQEAKVRDAQQSLFDALQDAFTKADDAVRTKVDQFFSNPRTANPQLNFTIADVALETSVESERLAMESLLTSWPAELGGLTVASDLEPHADAAKTNLGRLRSFLDKAALALNLDFAGGSLPQATLETNQSTVTTARANINTAMGNVSAAEADYLIGKEELKLKLAGASPEAIRAQQALSQEAKAKVDVVRAEFAKSVIRAPVGGLVTKIEFDVGEVVAANAPVVSLISDVAFEIKANVPEVDVGNILVGNPVRMSVDAFPGETFGGRVRAVDPAETVIEGVVNFEIRVAFEKPDPRLKSGLTANLAIETQKKSGVLILPQSAILERDQGALVRKLESNETREVEIVIGIRGRDGIVEILSGLAEGDKVLNVAARAEQE